MTVICGQSSRANLYKSVAACRLSNCVIVTVSVVPTVSLSRCMSEKYQPKLATQTVWRFTHVVFGESGSDRGITRRLVLLVDAISAQKVSESLHRQSSVHQKTRYPCVSINVAASARYHHPRQVWLGTTIKPALFARRCRNYRLYHLEVAMTIKCYSCLR